MVGEKWALLAIREISFGNRRFNEIARNTGAPRDRLAARLHSLVEAGILERREYQSTPPRAEYHLTTAGRDLAPVLRALVAWGDRWVSDEPPATLMHGDHELDPVQACRHCGAEAVRRGVGPGQQPGLGPARPGHGRRVSRTSTPGYRSDRREAAAWDAEYAAGRYAGDPPVASSATSSPRPASAGCGTGCTSAAATGGTCCPCWTPASTSPGWTFPGRPSRSYAPAAGPEPADHGRSVRTATGARYDLVVGIQVFQHGTRAQARQHLAAAAARVRPGGLLCVRVNAAGTDIEHAHRRFEEHGDGSFSVRYRGGPKAGLDIHFFTAAELAAVVGDGSAPRCRPGGRAPRGPRPAAASGPSGRPSGCAARLGSHPAGRRDGAKLGGRPGAGGAGPPVRRTGHSSWTHRPSGRRRASCAAVMTCPHRSQTWPAACASLLSGSRNSTSSSSRSRSRNSRSSSASVGPGGASSSNRFRSSSPYSGPKSGRTVIVGPLRVSGHGRGRGDHANLSHAPARRIVSRAAPVICRRAACRGLPPAGAGRHPGRPARARRRRRPGPEPGELPGQGGRGPVGVEAAGVRQHPQPGRAGGGGLGAHDRPGMAERGPVDGHAEHGEPLRAQPGHLLLQRQGTLAQLGRGQLGGPGRGPGGHVGDPEPQGQELVLLVRPELARGEPGPVQGRPEAVTRAGEMMAGRRRVQTGVNAREHDAQAPGEDIGDRGVPGRLQIGRGRPRPRGTGRRTGILSHTTTLLGLAAAARRPPAARPAPGRMPGS